MLHRSVFHTSKIIIIITTGLQTRNNWQKSETNRSISKEMRIHVNQQKKSKIKLICRDCGGNRWSGWKGGGGGWEQNRLDYIHRALCRPRRGWVCRPCRCGFAECGPRCATPLECWSPGTAGRWTPFVRPSCAWSSVWKSGATQQTHSIKHSHLGDPKH